MRQAFCQTIRSGQPGDELHLLLTFLGLMELLAKKYAQGVIRPDFFGQVREDLEFKKSTDSCIHGYEVTTYFARPGVAPGFDTRVSSRGWCVQYLPDDINAVGVRLEYKTIGSETELTLRAISSYEEKVAEFCDEFNSLISPA